MTIRQGYAYTGIGSRAAPENILKQMEEIAGYLATNGWTLRSGGAYGADTAFEVGCDNAEGSKEIFLPYKGFNYNLSPLCNPPYEAYQIAAKYHPTWFALKPIAKKFHARNAQQVLGENLDTPCKFVVCWTPDGAETKTTRKTGGTGQAIRIANRFNVPVFNLFNEGRYEQVLEVNRDYLMQYSDYFD